MRRNGAGWCGRLWNSGWRSESLRKIRRYARFRRGRRRSRRRGARGRCRSCGDGGREQERCAERIRRGLGMRLSEIWRRLFSTKYSAILEAEVARLRAENRALLNSILGIAGVPPITVSAAETAVGPGILPASAAETK